MLYEYNRLLLLDGQRRQKLFKMGRRVHRREFKTITLSENETGIVVEDGVFQFIHTIHNSIIGTLHLGLYIG